MLKVLLPLLAFVVVLVGLIAVEPPPTAEELEQRERHEKLNQIQAEHDELIDQLNTLEREEQLLRSRLSKANSLDFDNPAMTESLERLKANAERDKRAAEASIARLNEEMSSVEKKAEDWVRTAYNLTPDALPPGYLARVLWRLDGTTIAETGKLAKDLRATLHITETAAQTAAQRVSSILKSGYARRTLVTAAAALATLALIESAEPAFGWVFERWWKLLAAGIAGLLAFGAVVMLQRRKIFE